MLYVEMAVEDASYVEWYPSVDAAKAALAMVAGDSRVERGGAYVDLTVAGCSRSEAWVETRPAAE